MAEEKWSGQMADAMRAAGNTIRLVVKANSLIQPVISTTGLGLTTRRMASANTLLLVELDLKAIGETITNMVRAKKL